MMNLAATASEAPLTLREIEATQERLAHHIIETPIHRWQGPEVEALVGGETQIILKLELFQRAGSFKLRGALNNILQLDAEQLRRGVTAVSSGNHAVATSFAAKLQRTSAKLVMMRGASPYRMELCRRNGAELIIADNVHAAFELVRDLEAREGRYFVHPFEGRRTALGAATAGLEFCRQAEGLDAVIVAIGGGGLCGGVSAAVKLLSPGTRIFGVEPENSNAMAQSIAAGRPVQIDAGPTIADSLNAPYAAPFTFSLCQANLAGVVTVSDDEIREAMRVLFGEMKLAVEPAAAAATAALCGPLRDRLRGHRVGILLCGTNTDIETLARHLHR